MKKSIHFTFISFFHKNYMICYVEFEQCFNASRTNPGRREKIKSNFYFDTTFKNARDEKGQYQV